MMINSNKSEVKKDCLWYNEFWDNPYCDFQEVDHFILILPSGVEYDGIYVVGIIKSGQNITIEKPACFGEPVQLESRVKIKELTSVGNNVKIGEDTVIEKSVIWDEVKIGAGCIITESYICNNCEIGDNVVLERAIIAPNCKINDNSQVRDKTLELGQEI